MKTRAAYSLLLLIVLAGGALRFHELSRPSLWDDEMSTLKDISSGRSQQLERMRTYDLQPPLYFEQLRLWSGLFGSDLGRLRANSALWGTLSIAALFFLGLALFGRAEPALLAAALLALSPFHLAYSQELRPYAFAVFLAIAGFWAVERALEKDGRLWAVCALLMTAELYAHYWELFVFAAQAVYGWRRLKDPRRRRRWLLLCSAAAAAFIPWLPVLRQQLAAGPGLVRFWAFPASPANLVRTLLAYSGFYFRFASSDFALSWPRALTILAGGAGSIGLAFGLRKSPVVVRLWLALGLGIPYLISYWSPGFYVWYRYTLLAYPAFALWLAGGFGDFPRRWTTAACAGLFLLSSAWGCGQYARGWQKANPKAVMACVNSLAGEGAVVVRPAYFSDLFGYYYAAKAPVLDEDAFDDDDARAKLRGKKIVLLAFDSPEDPIPDSFLKEFRAESSAYFPAYARLGITVYRLR